MKNIFSVNNLRVGLAWIFTIVGVLLYVVDFLWIDVNSVWWQIVMKIADVLVIGVVLGFVTNSAQFIGIFKQDLQDIIYGKDFIKKRNDIEIIWDNISKIMFKEKFPKIHKELLSAIKKYLPQQAICYCENREDNICIEWIDKELGMIKTTKLVTFDLVLESTEKFNFQLSSRGYSDENEPDFNKIVSFFVDNVDETKSVVKTMNSGKKDSEGRIVLEQQVTLKGKTKYTIKYTREASYNMNMDSSICSRVRYITHGLRLSLSLPEDISAEFICRGTQDDFEDVGIKVNRIEKKYRGIIFPRQGYVFALRKK